MRSTGGQASPCPSPEACSTGGQPPAHPPVPCNARRIPLLACGAAPSRGIGSPAASSALPPDQPSSRPSIGAAALSRTRPPPTCLPSGVSIAVACAVGARARGGVRAPPPSVASFIIHFSFRRPPSAPKAHQVKLGPLPSIPQFLACDPVPAYMKPLWRNDRCRSTCL